MRIIAFLTLAISFASSIVARQPNVVLVMTDDQGYGDLSCHGNPDFKTPHLDRLHDESVRFTDFHVDPTCAPTRAALITGRYSLSTGVWHTIAGRSFLHPEEVTMANVLQRGGYATGMFGKWHLGDNYPCRPHDRGFDTAVYHGGGGVGQTPDLWGNDYFDDRYFRNGEPTQYQGYCTDVFFNEAMSFMKASKTQPFFCYLLPNAPHGPYNVAKQYSEPFREKGFSKNRSDFYGMLVNFDENMGRLEQFLKQEGLRENTIVIFMTDNGTAGPWYPKEGEDHTAGLRGIKGAIYEGGHRVPFFVRWPGGNISGGRDVSHLAAHIDVLPTLAELCGVQRESGPKLHGRSLVPLLRDRNAGWTSRDLVVNNQRIAEPKKYKDFVVMSEDWRLVGRQELYNLKNDRAQANNVAARHPAVVSRLIDVYEEWWEETSGRAGTLVPITVGHEADNPSFLTAHDWHASQLPWHQEVVVEAPAFNGHWEIDVAQAGSYRVTLMERPAEADFPINAVKATLSVGGNMLSKKIPKGVRQISFNLDLEGGRTQLKSTIVDESGKERGAYFASVLKRSEPARNQVEKNDEANSGPMFKEAGLVGSRVRVSFNHVGSGLMAAGTNQLPPAVGSKVGLKCFQIRATDGEWKWAQARIISPSKVDVWHTEVLRPAEVRYARPSNSEEVQLYNKEGHAASAFKTDELTRVQPAWRKGEYDEAIPVPTYSNVSYGDHPRNVLDFWKSAVNRPTPLVIVIHGGGWNGGNKEKIDSFVDTTALLDVGIAVAAINYRLIKHSRGLAPPVSGPLYDAARAVQFLRSRADEFNIDKSRIAATGGSAGACTSLWLAYHDDLADSENEDPVLRESTRLACVAPIRGQTTLDPLQMRTWIPNSKYGAHAFGLDSFESFLAERERILSWIKEYSPYSLLSADDPPTYMYYPIVPAEGVPEKDPTHSASFGVGLQKRCQELGVPSELYYPGAANASHSSATDYLIAQLQTDL